MSATSYRRFTDVETTSWVYWAVLYHNGCILHIENLDDTTLFMTTVILYKKHSNGSATKWTKFTQTRINSGLFTSNSCRSTYTSGKFDNGVYLRLC